MSETLTAHRRSFIRKKKTEQQESKSKALGIRTGFLFFLFTYSLLAAESFYIAIVTSLFLFLKIFL
jgi:hypothetical protein